jgi:hypothetical protein
MENIFLKYKSILLLLIGLIASNCSKESTKEICISGYVYSTNNETPVAGALVFIIGYEDSYLGSTNTYVVDETKTDSEGKYSFKYKEKSKYSYRVSTSHPKYFFDQRQSEIVLSSNPKQKANLYLIPEAWVKLFARRVSNNVISCLFLDAQIRSFDTSGVFTIISKYRYYSGPAKIPYSARLRYPNNNIYDIGGILETVLPQFDTTDIRIEW